MSDINVFVRTQRIIVDAASSTVSVISAGPIGPQGASKVTMPWHADGTANLALTNSPLAERFALNVPARVIKLAPDMQEYTQVRAIGNVATLSASAGTPKVRFVYKTGAYSTVLANYSNIGVTEVSLSLAATGHVDTGWIDLVAGAIGDCFIGLTEQGGDGVIDPAFGYLNLHLR